MAKITNGTAYKATLERIEELIPLVDDNTPLDDKNLIELDLLSDLVSVYEEIHYPIETSSLKDLLVLRMEEMGLDKHKLAVLLGTSINWVNNFLSGKTVPSYKTAQNISKKLNIDGNLVLGTYLQ